HRPPRVRRGLPHLPPAPRRASPGRSLSVPPAHRRARLVARAARLQTKSRRAAGRPAARFPDESVLPRRAKRRAQRRPRPSLRAGAFALGACFGAELGRAPFVVDEESREAGAFVAGAFAENEDGRVGVSFRSTEVARLGAERELEGREVDAFRSSRGGAFGSRGGTALRSGMERGVDFGVCGGSATTRRVGPSPLGSFREGATLRGGSPRKGSRTEGDDFPGIFGDGRAGAVTRRSTRAGSRMAGAPRRRPDPTVGRDARSRAGSAGRAGRTADGR